MTSLSETSPLSLFRVSVANVWHWHEQHTPPHLCFILYCFFKKGFSFVTLSASYTRSSWGFTGVGPETPLLIAKRNCFFCLLPVSVLCIQQWV